MNLTYTLNVEGREYKTYTDLDKFITAAKELKVRRTGRTTKMLEDLITSIQSCSDKSPHIVFFRTNTMAKYMVPMFLSLLNKTNMYYGYNGSNIFHLNGSTIKFLGYLDTHSSISILGDQHGKVTIHKDHSCFEK